MARPKKSASIIKTVIPGAHVFQDLEKNGKLPVLKSVGFAKVSPNSRDYVAYVITSKGDKVLSMEVCEPNLKAIASDEAKINFVTILEDADQTLEEDIQHLKEDEKARAQA